MARQPPVQQAVRLPGTGICPLTQGKVCIIHKVNTKKIKIIIQIDKAAGKQNCARIVVICPL